MLAAIGGPGFRLDLVQLGLGDDGHTASLVPGDPVLQVGERDVAIASEYQGTRRMTLTLPVLSRARLRLWLVTGSDKAAVLDQLLAGSADIPANRVERRGALVVADRAAAPLESFRDDPLQA
jgi:6-phosphogluconolactonase/glucosamine-6-phosphate isomerase/deaminase